MPRRVSLPAADELFRTTGGSAVQPSAPQQQGAEPRVPAPAGEPAQERAGETGRAAESGESGEHATAEESGSPSGGAPEDGTHGPGGPGEHYGRGGQGSGSQASVPGQSAGRQGAGQTSGSAAQSQQTAPDQQEARRSLAGRSAQASAAPARGQAKSRQSTGGSGSRRSRAANRRPSGRERHDEKITVYVSAEELMDLEHARLVLRGEHGLAVDRGRIVREAVAVVLADLESRGDASILVRRLRGR